MNATLNAWISKHHRDEPNAAEFAELLDEKCIWSADDFDYAGWDAPIPSRDQWETEIANLNSHLQTFDQ